MNGWRVIRWFRVVLPRLGYVAVFLLAYGGGLLWVTSVEAKVGRRWPEMRVLSTQPFLILGLASYAVYRVVAFHPAMRRGYRSWLANTPWTGDKPLPAGPVHLVLQDVVLLSCALVLGWATVGEWQLYLAQSFLLAYLLPLAIALFVTGEWAVGYLLVFVLGLVVRLWHDAAFSALTSIAAYGFGYVGLRRSFRRFPWSTKWLDPGITKEQRAGFSTSSIGWPHARLAPKWPEDANLGIPLLHGLCVSTLIGWWLYALAGLMPIGPREGVPIMALLFATFIVPVARLGIYCEGYQHPISFWGRIFTGRWIIKGYDQVLAAPLLAGFVGLVCLAVSVNLESGEVTGPIGMTLILAVTLGMGPSLNYWRLTGNHRIVEGKQQGTIKVA